MTLIWTPRDAMNMINSYEYYYSLIFDKRDAGGDQIHGCMRLETRSTIRSFMVLTLHSKTMPHYKHPMF